MYEQSSDNSDEPQISIHLDFYDNEITDAELQTAYDKTLDDLNDLNKENV